MILETERQDYFKQREEINEKVKKMTASWVKGKVEEKEKLENQKKDLDANYIPIDFDSYSIEDRNLILNKQEKLKNEDQIWRISSLTAYVDNDTKILLMPMPESKRQVKIKDTVYSFETVGDLIERRDAIEKSLVPEEDKTEHQRFEDKTEEEISKDMVKKR